MYRDTFFLSSFCTSILEADAKMLGSDKCASRSSPLRFFHSGVLPRTLQSHVSSAGWVVFRRLRCGTGLVSLSVWTLVYIPSDVECSFYNRSGARFLLTTTQKSIQNPYRQIKSFSLRRNSVDEWIYAGGVCFDFMAVTRSLRAE